jgi:hypothetical protein
MPDLFRRERPSGRLITLEGYSENNLPIVLTEFGGIAYSTQRDGYWGYSTAGSSAALCERYTALLDVVRTLPALAGFCYTQFTDTYQEANGLLHFDRTPKFALEQIADATRGPRVPRTAQVESVKRAERGAPGSQHDPVAP